MELEGQLQNLDQTSSEKDTLIDKYKMEIKEGKRLSQCDEKCPCIYRLNDCLTEMALELSQLKQKLKSAKVYCMYLHMHTCISVLPIPTCNEILTNY